MKALNGNDANRDETHCAKYGIQTKRVQRQKLQSLVVETLGNK